MRIQLQGKNIVAFDPNVLDSLVGVSSDIKDGNQRVVVRMQRKL